MTIIDEISDKISPKQYYHERMEGVSHKDIAASLDVTAASLGYWRDAKGLPTSYAGSSRTDRVMRKHYVALRELGLSDERISKLIDLSTVSMSRWKLRNNIRVPYPKHPNEQQKIYEKIVGTIDVEPKKKRAAKEPTLAPPPTPMPPFTKQLAKEFWPVVANAAPRQYHKEALQALVSICWEVEQHRQSTGEVPTHFGSYIKARMQKFFLH